MTTKEIAIDTIRQLPDNATWEDIQERIRFLASLDKGLNDLKTGKLVPHEDVRKSLEQWLAR